MPELPLRLPLPPEAEQSACACRTKRLFSNHWIRLLYLTRYILSCLLGLLELFSFVDGVSLVLGPPGGHLGVELGDEALHFHLNLLLLIQLLLQEVQVMSRVSQSDESCTPSLKEEELGFIFSSDKEEFNLEVSR